MWKRGLAALALLALFAGKVMPQEARSVVGEVARAMGATSLKSIEYSGNGFIFPFGQSWLPGGPWPRFNLKSYTLLADYERGAFREENVRTYLDPPEKGGSALFIGELRQVAFLSGDSAWNLGGNGVPSPAPASVEERQLQLLSTPHGWVKAAMAANPTAKSRSVNGKKMTVVSFTVKGKYKVNGYVNSQNLLERVETWLPDPVLGDTLVETSFADYRDYSGVKFPAKIVVKQGGFPVLDLAVSEVRPNVPANIEVPQAVLGAVPPPARAVSQKVAEGVWLVGGASHNSVIVEFKDYMVVIDAPLNEERSLVVIAEVKKLVPQKPLRYLINTHHHFDHSGGLRAYVAEGITVITHQVNKPFYEKVVLKAPHTLAPDKLSQNPKAAKFIWVGDKYVLTDGARILELHLTQGNPHNPGLLMAYLPKEKLLVEADSHTVPPPNTPPPPAVNVVNTRNLNLQENIQRLKLDVEQILPIHGRIMPIAEFRKLIGMGG